MRILKTQRRRAFQRLFDACTIVARIQLFTRNTVGIFRYYFFTLLIYYTEVARKE